MSDERVAQARPWTGAAEAAALAAALADGWLADGPRTRAFEEAVAGLTGARHVIATATGTAALHLALRGLGIGPGSEVVVPSLTFCATVQAIVATGAQPRFAEIDPATGCLDPRDAEACCRPATRAILPVHFGGHAAEMDDILSVARSAGIAVVEDAAHAFGGRYGSSCIGTIGDVTCFSFDPIKTITCGQGGAVCTDRDDVADAMRTMADLGIVRGADRRDYQVIGHGLRSRMSDLNAAIGLTQLSRFDEIAERRRALWAQYHEMLGPVAGIELLDHDLAKMVPFMFVIKVPGDIRLGLQKRLLDVGIETAVTYPPNHQQPAFQYDRPELPVTEKFCREIVTLPFHTGLTSDDVNRVVHELRAVLADS